MRIITLSTGAGFLPTPGVLDRLTFHIIYQPLRDNLVVYGSGDAVSREITNGKQSA